MPEWIHREYNKKQHAKGVTTKKVYRISKIDYREILRLEATEYAQRRMATSMRSLHHPVAAVLDAAKEEQMSWPVEEGISNEALGENRFPDKYYTMKNYAEHDCAIIHKGLAKPGVNMTLLWEEYRTRCHGGRLSKNTILVFDPVTGIDEASYLFIAVLSCSCKEYAKPYLNMKMENRLLCYVHTYNYFAVWPVC